MKTKQTAPVPMDLFDRETPDTAALKAALDAAGLLFPLLQAGMVNGYFADKHSAQLMPLQCTQTDAGTTLKLDIQFQSLMAGCACDDDPTPQQPLTEFMRCTLTFSPSGWLQAVHIED